MAEVAVPVFEGVDSVAVNLCTTLAGDADTDTMDRRYIWRGPCLLRVVSAIGAAPTVKLDIQGSMDGTNFYNVAYSLPATPTTYTVAQITITTATTGHYILAQHHPWRYLKCVTSANTTVTLTIDAFPTEY